MEQEHKRKSDDILIELQVSLARLLQQKDDLIDRMRFFETSSKEWQISHDSSSFIWRTKMEDKIERMDRLQIEMKQRLNIISWSITLILIPVMTHFIAFMTEVFFKKII